MGFLITLTFEVCSILIICNGKIKKTEVAFPLKRLGPHLKKCYVSTISTVLKNLLTKRVQLTLIGICLKTRGRQ